MAEYDEIFDGIKQQAIETRNLVIKTDNLIKNLAIDVRSLQKQLSSYHSKGRWFIFVGYIVIIVIIAGAAYLVTSAQTAASEKRAQEQKQAMATINERYTNLQNDFARFKAKTKREVSRKESTQQKAAMIMQMIAKRQDRDVVKQARTLDVSLLGPVSQNVLGEKLKEVRKRQGEASYRAGKLAYDRKNYPKAISECELAIELNHDASYLPNAYFYLAMSLAHSNKDDKKIRAKAIQTFDEFIERYPRHTTADDALFHKATFCERWEDMKCSKQAWQMILTNYAGSPAAATARKKLKSLQESQQ